jgi:hypothetical protein
MKNTILNTIASAHHDYAAPLKTLLSLLQKYVHWVTNTPEQGV